MRNRALIANWAVDLDKDHTVVSIVERDSKHYVEIKDYEALRAIFAEELHEIQRIKSEGDFDAAKCLVEKYGIKLDPTLHREVLHRYELLNIAPYKGFINPWMKPQYDADGNIKDIVLDYTETYSHQMLRYSGEY